MAGHDESPLHHVLDQPTLELPHWAHPFGLELKLPDPFGVQVTRFMVTELVASLLVLGIMIPVCRHISRNPVSRGGFFNAFETILYFIRDKIARPAIGGHGADTFLPYLWTVFFFILFNNLLGLVPGMASATGNINVTGVLAVMTFGAVLFAGTKEKGAVGFWLGLVPHLDVPGWLKPPLWTLMLIIEVAGLFIRHIVLAVRLFANMFAGHIVLAVIVGFIAMAQGTYAYWPVAGLSVFGLIAVSMLELLVAFLQAYVFTFLSAIFIGSAEHSH